MRGRSCVISFRNGFYDDEDYNDVGLCRPVDRRGMREDGPTASSRAATKYTCLMHPEVVQGQGGELSKVRMKLVEKK